MKLLISTMALTLVSTAVQARDVGDAAVSVGLSSFGGNLEAAYATAPNWDVRGAFMGGFSYSDTDQDGDETTEVDANLGALAVLADYYPTGSGWHISGGVLFSSTDFQGTITGDVEFNGIVFPNESVELEAAFKNEIAPMITSGYRFEFGDGWSFNTEAGIVFIGGVDLTATASNSAVQDEVDNDEDIQDAQDDAADLTVLPYLALGLSYRF